MMKVAVTGGAGFIGKALLKALAEAGYQVKALENRTPVLQHQNITPVKGSLRDADALQTLIKGCDAVIHAAGLVAARRSRQFYDVNTEGTRRLAQIATYNNCGRFLLVSSLSAREEKLSHYGNSKQLAEDVLGEFSDMGWDAIRPPAVAPGTARLRICVHADHEPGTVDAVVTFRNFHGWIRRGQAEAVIQAVFEALEPGGIFGVVQHRAPEGAVTANWVEKGYVPEAALISLIEAGGFEIEGRSEINANRFDTKDYPEGVWTLPPTYRLGDQDRQRYSQIGESDRMTLKFVKPAY